MALQAEELRRGLRVAGRMLLFNPRAFADIPGDRDSVRRSFQVMLLVLPVMFLWVQLQHPFFREQISSTDVALRMGLYLLIAYMVMPVLILGVAPAIGAPQETALRSVYAHNWTQCAIDLLTGGLMLGMILLPQDSDSQLVLRALQSLSLFAEIALMAFILRAGLKLSVAGSIALSVLRQTLLLLIMSDLMAELFDPATLNALLDERASDT